MSIEPRSIWLHLHEHVSELHRIWKACDFCSRGVSSVSPFNLKERSMFLLALAKSLALNSDIRVSLVCSAFEKHDVARFHCCLQFKLCVINWNMKKKTFWELDRSIGTKLTEVTNTDSFSRCCVS